MDMTTNVVRLRFRGVALLMMLGIGFGFGAGSGAAHAAPPTESSAPPKGAQNVNPSKNAKTGTPPPAPVFKKLSPGPVVRIGMDRVARLLKDAQTEPSLKRDAYLELADKVDAEMKNMVKMRKLDEKADRVFQEVYTDILLATTLMRRDKTQIEHAGILALTQSLKNYAKYFDHPGWTGPQGN